MNIEQASGEEDIPRMKTIGIIAGLAAPQATFDFESAIHQMSRKFIPQHFTTGYPPMVVIHFRDVPFRVDADGKFLPEPNPHLLETAKILGGISDFLIIFANAPHLFKEQIEKATGKRVLSMVDVTLEEIKKRKLERVGIITIGIALKNKLYQKPLDTAGIPWESVPDELVDKIDQSVFKVMEGENPEKLGQAAQEAVDYLRQKNVDGIILGCTEIPLLLGKRSRESDLINPAQLLAEAAVKKALGK